MTNTAIAQALQRKQANPALYKVPASGRSRQGRDLHPAYIAMVADLNDNIEDISQREISTFLKLSRRTVAKIIDEIEPLWSTVNNEVGTVAELAALKRHHTRYEDDPAAVNEPDSKVVLFAAPLFRDSSPREFPPDGERKVITLPQFPFLPLPERLVA